MAALPPPEAATDLGALIVVSSILISGIFALLAAFTDLINDRYFPGLLDVDLLSDLGIFLAGVAIIYALLRLVHARMPRALGSAAAVEPPRAEEPPLPELAPTSLPEPLFEPVEFESWSLPGGLTPREAEILALLVNGRTVAEVSGALFISTHTVTRHIANTYAKIGARNRAEAIAWAIEAGIAGRSAGGDAGEALAELGQPWR